MFRRKQPLRGWPENMCSKNLLGNLFAQYLGWVTFFCKLTRWMPTTVLKMSLFTYTRVLTIFLGKVAFLFDVFRTNFPENLPITAYDSSTRLLCNDLYNMILHKYRNCWNILWIDSPNAFINGAKYSRKDQVKLFKGCLPQISLGPLFLNTLSQIIFHRK